MGDLRVLTNVRLVTPTGIRPGPLAWNGGRIVDAPDPAGGWDTARVEDGGGALVVPGLVDPHVHSREPGMTEKETFAAMTAGALKGGVTTVFEMPNSKPPLLRSGQVAEREADFGRSSHVNFGLWALALGDDRFDDIAAVIEAGAVGVKAFYGYRFDTVDQRFLYTVGPSDIPDRILPPLDSARLRHIAEQVAASGGVLAVHCEDPAYLGGGGGYAAPELVAAPYRRLLEERPPSAEDSAVLTAVELAESTGCAVHVVHLASGSAVPLIAEAKSRGVPITAETAPHYWLLSAEEVGGMGAAAKVNPPIREDSHRRRIQTGLLDGTIDFLASDHAPHAPHQKAVDILESPAGISGIDTIGPLAIDAYLRGKVDAATLLRLTSAGAAGLFGLLGRKASLSPGADADFVLVDPGAEVVVTEDWMWSKAKLTPFAGRVLKGRVDRVVVGGEDHFRDGRIVSISGARPVRLTPTR